jgi:predicted nucleotidyltransferase
MPPRKSSRNVEMLGVVAKGLKGLKDEVVFVGGATIDLFITDPAAPGTRETDDVDCVIELVGKAKYYALEEKLRALGFQNPLDEEKPVLCRWKFCGITVDVMPTDASVLGFTNRWYRDGMIHAEEFKLPNGERVSVLSLPYLIATKLEAFHGRGKGDYMGSKDIEDIVALLDGCSDAEQKIVAAPAEIQKYLRQEFAKLLVDNLFLAGLEGHLTFGPGVRDRLDRCLDILRRIALPD